MVSTGSHEHEAERNVEPASLGAVHRLEAEVVDKVQEVIVCAMEAALLSMLPATSSAGLGAPPSSLQGQAAQGAQAWQAQVCAVPIP